MDEFVGGPSGEVPGEGCGAVGGERDQADAAWFPEQYPEEFEDWDVVPDRPDAVGLILEADALMSVFAAERFWRIDAMRVDALTDALARDAGSVAVTERSIRLELAAALGVTENTAQNLIWQAELLVHRHPAVLHALGRAVFSVRHAVEIIEGLQVLDPHLRGRVEAEAIGLAKGLGFGPFRRALRTMIEGVRSDTLTQRHARALSARRVVVEHGEDGMGWLHWYGPAVEVTAAHHRVTAIGNALRKVAGETRTLDQLRSDVLGDLLIDGNTGVLPGVAGGIRATVVVTVPALALLDEDGDGGGQARVEGVGPIPIERARELCGAASGWMRVLTHPETGIVLSVGRDQYRPPAELRRAVRWRAGTCMAPGCCIPASRCEIDHTVDWNWEGETSLRNLAPLCKGHHTVKHHGRWRVNQSDDGGGGLDWESPSGRVYHVEPDHRLPVFTPQPRPAPF